MLYLDSFYEFVELLLKRTFAIVIEESADSKEYTIRFVMNINFKQQTTSTWKYEYDMIWIKKISNWHPLFLYIYFLTYLLLDEVIIFKIYFGFSGQICRYKAVFNFNFRKQKDELDKVGEEVRETILI